jgi:hypothetical protein
MAKSRRTGIDLNQWPIIVLIGLVLLTVLTWAVFNATKDNIPGTDFFIYYVAARQVTVDQGSPYAETVGEQSQIAVLKHPARPGEDQLRYVYPPYGLITILPLSVLPFSWAQAIWMSCSILGLLLSVLYGFRRISPVFLVTFFFLYPLTFGLLLGNLNMPVTVILILLAGRLKNLTNNQRIESVILGVLMAWATIKPQFSTFFILFFLMLALKKQNRIFLISFFTGGIALLIFSFALIPDWVPQWMALLKRYPGYIGGQVPITPAVNLLDTAWRGPAYVIIAAICVLFIGWLILRWWQQKATSILLLSAGTFVTYLFHPTGLSYDQLIFLLPFIFWTLEDWDQKQWLHTLIWLFAIVLSWVLVVLSVNHVWNGATYYGMYFLYIIWVMVFLVPWHHMKNWIKSPIV